jgi:two-component system sensor histidine kinase PilS (NtrC family)
MVQIFWNLARNALRAMPDGGRFEVRGRVEGDVYRLQFRDTGRGMTEAERRTLFQPFKTSFGGGSGLGMAIVYQIVSEHGGDLRVESAPDCGTTVTVELPLTRLRMLETAEAWT